MKHILLIILTFFFSYSFAEKKIFNVKPLTNFYMNPDLKSPIIYPIDHSKELLVKDNKDNWINVLDTKTGLVGWVLKEDFSDKMPKKKIISKNYDKSFKNFKGKVMEMSSSIKEAISIETFMDVIHLGGAAAVIIADDNWFEGRRHANQAFQVYELWRNENQSPSFLSFKNTKISKKLTTVLIK